jgi:hypothetical protein
MVVREDRRFGYQSSLGSQFFLFAGAPVWEAVA